MTGRHALQAVYGNGAGAINTGVTAAVKWLKIFDGETLITEGSWVHAAFGKLGHLEGKHFVWAHLEANKEYRIEISDGFNMSYLQHYINIMEMAEETIPITMSILLRSNCSLDLNNLSHYIPIS